MQQDRGREAEAPWRITARGWADILYRVWKDTGKKNLSLVAGGVTYYLLLALFPAMAALISVYGLVADPADMAKSVQSLSGMLSPSTVKLIGDELHQLVFASSKSLGPWCCHRHRDRDLEQRARDDRHDDGAQHRLRSARGAGIYQVQRDCAGANRRGNLRRLNRPGARRRAARDAERCERARPGALGRLGRRMAASNRVRHEYYCADLPLRA